MTAAAIAAAIVTQADRNLVLAAWRVGLIPNNLSTGTATNGTGSASIAAGDAILSYTDAQDGDYQPGAWTGPRVTLAGAIPFGSSFRVVARIVDINGDNTTLLRVGILSESDNQFTGLRMRASDGACTAYTTGGAVASSAVPLALDGTDWISFERHGGSSAWYRGTGTPTDPPAAGAWANIIVSANTDLPVTTFGIGLAKSANALPGDATVDNVYIQAI